MRIFSEAPADNASLRRSLYQGDVFALGPTTASEALVTDVRELLERTLESRDIRHAPSELDPLELFARMGRLRKTLYMEPRFHAHARAVIAAAGFDPAHVAFDPLRLRIISHLGHENPRAAPVYYPHRDTWYAHPQSIVTWWIPLDDLREEETFVFYPEAFDRPVANDSEIFDYDAWVARGWSLKIGWQDPEAGRTARYPRALEPSKVDEGVGFACRRAQNLLFAGAHYHQTRPQALGTTRYSLDFRVVDLRDEAAGLGAPNSDNRSRGSALADYTHPAHGGA